MQMLSPGEKATLDARLADLHRQKVEVQGRITTAAALGDLSENAEYHFAKEENRKVEAEISELQKKLRDVVVADSEGLPEDMVFLGSTVRVRDPADGEEMIFRIVGEAGAPSIDSDVQDVSAASPIGDALVKARVGDTVTVKAPRGAMKLEIVELL